MEKFLSNCGLDCASCGAFRAYKTDDDEIRKQTAAEWSKMFNIEIDYKTINCEGCKSNGKVLMGHCHTCKIRVCAEEKKVENCAHCKEYACEKLDVIFEHSKEAKMNLDRIWLGM